MALEAEALGEVEADLKDGAHEKFTKRAKFQAHWRQSSKPYE